MSAIQTPGPWIRLDGPLPQPRRYTLLDVAQYVDLGPDERWGNGAWIQSYPMDPVSTFDPCSHGSEAQKTPGGAISLARFAAFQAYLTEQCVAAVVGPDPNAWFTARAAAAFRVREQAAAERVLAYGDHLPVFVDAPGTPHLTDANLVELDGGTAQNYLEGLALLEEAIGGTDSAGVIHTTPSIATLWSARLLIAPDNTGTVLRTTLGTPVVVGDGYIGAHPDHTVPPAATQQWSFATGPLRYLTDPAITLPPRILPLGPAPNGENPYAMALNRSDNTVTYRAERDYVVVFDSDTTSGSPTAPLQVGVLIDRTLTTP
jgi:hypothetical protein